MSIVSIASIADISMFSGTVSGTIGKVEIEVDVEAVVVAVDEANAAVNCSEVSWLKSSLRSPTSRDSSVLELGRKLSRMEVRSGRLALSRSSDNWSCLENMGLGGLVTCLGVGVWGGWWWYCLESGVTGQDLVMGDMGTSLE